MANLPTDDSVEQSMAEPAVFEEPTPTAPAGPRLVLRRAGVDTEHVFPFSAPAVIGRFDPEVGPVDIDLGDIDESRYVSRRHAKITGAEDALWIEDLGSSNGTYLLREGMDDYLRVTEPSELMDGDQVVLGNAKFVLHI